MMGSTERAVADMGTAYEHGMACSVPPRCGTLIKGLDPDGQAFRPSDWAQRLAAAATVNCGYCGGTGEGRFNPHARVLYLDGLSCLWVGSELQTIDPPLHAFIMSFAGNNGLAAIEGCR